MQIRFPGGRSKALTLSYDDGVEQDVRLMEILQKHGIKCTFNLNSGLYAQEGTVYPQGQVHRRMTLGRMQEAYAHDDWEVAVHGLHHAWMPELGPGELVWEVIKDRENLERDFDCMVRGMAYPYGRLNDNIVETLRRCGISYARTVRSTHSFELPTDLLRWDPTCHHRDEKLLDLCDAFLKHEALNDGKLFYLWGHSYEFEGDDNWHVIEAFAEKMGGRQDVWYATNQQIVDYLQAARSLHISVNSDRVYNPSALTVWLGIERGKESFPVHPGQTWVRA